MGAILRGCNPTVTFKNIVIKEEIYKNGNPIYSFKNNFSKEKYFYLMFSKNFVHEEHSFQLFLKDKYFL